MGARLRRARRPSTSSGCASGSCGLIGRAPRAAATEELPPEPARRIASSATSRRSARCTRRAQPLFPTEALTRDGSRLPAEIVAAMGGRSRPSEQWRAISWPLEPFVLVAGAGSGKTSVMAARVVYLALAAIGRVRSRHAGRAARQRAVPDVHEQGDREPARCGSAARSPTLELAEGEEPEILNYHGFAAQLLDRYGMLAGIEPGQRVLVPGPARRAVRARAGRDDVRARAGRVAAVAGRQDPELDDQAANHRATPAERSSRSTRSGWSSCRSTRPTARIAPRSSGSSWRGRSSGFRRAEARAGRRSTSATRSRSRSRSSRSIPEVVGDYRTRFGAVLLDEYQDTNVAQAELIARRLRRRASR